MHEPSPPTAPLPAASAERLYELRLMCGEASADPVSDLLIDDLGALSVSVEDADTGTVSERALFGEPGHAAPRNGWQRSVLKALFASESDCIAAATLILAKSADDAVRVLSLDPLDAQDWVRLTQSQFAPVGITPSFWIVPSWHQAPAAATRTIRLDPGLAFGTGTHATTRMCLRWIARHAAERPAGWSRVLDYGCGSGILAIGAALHGAQRIDAVDIDPAAVATTEANAAVNGVALRAGPPDLADGPYALVLANILAAPLQLLAPLLCSLAAPGGELVLAGILERQAGELSAAYAPWCNLAVADTDDGWILMTARLAGPR